MVLTQELSEARSQVVKKGSIRYDFHLNLQSGDNYEGFAQIRFELLSIPKELFIDYSGREVNRLIVNGKEYEGRRSDGYIWLEGGWLREGQNVLGVHYKTGYDNDGSGCCSFVDVDGKQYVYSLFEPYYSNRMFPCFDQPDLKAQMQLNVICPQHWKKVISNETATHEGPLDQQAYIDTARTSLSAELDTYLKGKSGKMTLFPLSKLLSTYLLGCVAGEYLQLKHPTGYNGIPMSLYCIESLFESLKHQAQMMFEVTIEAMRFYEEYFGHKFAFNKYDQIFAHEYKWGAMENAGMVTFNDKLIYTEKVSNERLFTFANVVTHELSHHWFGNLVTMKWWDDVWLNQSFADFISHFCLQKINHRLKVVQFESPMGSFLKRKGWGYDEDQMITTHPIRGPVPNTSVAESIFDGITYSKGASTMKQLLYLVGEDNYSRALASYFHKYEWSNTTIQDFLGELQKEFAVEEFTLAEWRQQWLQKESLNVAEVNWNPQDASQQCKLTIKQSFSTPNHPTLRHHKIKVGLFKESCQVDVRDVFLNPAADTVITYDGREQYKGVLLNYEDHAFIKIRIDPASLEFFVSNMSKIKDVLSRSLIWRSYFEMVKDALVKTDLFVEAALKNLSQQPSDGVVQRLLEDLSVALGSYTPSKFSSQHLKAVFKYLLDWLPTIPPEQNNRRVIVKSKLFGFVSDDDDKKLVLSWMEGKEQKLKEFTLSLGQKWSVVLHAFTLPDLTREEKQAYFTDQKQLDNSDVAKNHRHTCDVLLCNEEEYENYYQCFIDPNNKYSTTVKESLASGWNNSVHKDRLKNYRKRYFQDLQKCAGVLTPDHFRIFYQNLKPGGDNLGELIAEYEKIKFPEGEEKSTRNILKIIDQLRKRQKAYQLYE